MPDVPFLEASQNVDPLASKFELRTESLITALYPDWPRRSRSTHIQLGFDYGLDVDYDSDSDPMDRVNAMRVSQDRDRDIREWTLSVRAINLSLVIQDVIKLILIDVIELRR